MWVWTIRPYSHASSGCIIKMRGVELVYSSSRIGIISAGLYRNRNHWSTGKPSGKDSQGENQQLDPELAVHCVALLGQRILCPLALVPAGGVV